MRCRIKPGMTRIYVFLFFVILSLTQNLGWSRMKQYYVYILTNKSNRVLYIGVTNDLARRILEHKQKRIKGFTQKYNCTKLVYFEETKYIHDALRREKQLKNWHRAWKIDLITEDNPNWDDLSETFGSLGDAGSSPA